jgi:BASS family bile acid:Na+ symporter
MIENIDLVRLNFSPTVLNIMNIILGFVVFGVALNMKVSDFTNVFKNPKAAFLGLGTQFFIFPMLTYFLALLINPAPSIAMGMILVASCPGGNISNFMTQYARGNAALSVSMSGISTAAATIMTPLNMSIWGGLYVNNTGLMKEFSLNFWDMSIIIFTLLIIPTILGLLTTKHFPRAALRLKVPMQYLSILFFLGFVLIATVGNWEYFKKYYYIFFSIVIVHNLLSLLSGFTLASLFKLNEADKRAVTIEVGIQNSGLGLIIIFNEFDGLGGMAIVAAAWGIWHIIAGLSLASYWRSKNPEELPAPFSKPYTSLE